MWTPVDMKSKAVKHPALQPLLVPHDELKRKMQPLKYHNSTYLIRKVAGFGEQRCPLI